MQKSTEKVGTAMRIKITSDGPYIVTGGIPIREQVIKSKAGCTVFEDGRALPQAQTYALCRCGLSKNAPFCDGNHLKNNFCGTELANQEPYKSRLKDVVFGTTINLYDDGRCALARFCHTDRGDTWTVAAKDAIPENRQAAIKSAHQCPAGRLVAVDKDGNTLEEELTPEIIVMQDPETGVSSAIFVKGPIVVESADGTEYEVRNRVALCRCGNSQNKPFCDARHIPNKFDDGFFKK